MSAVSCDNQTWIHPKIPLFPRECDLVGKLSLVQTPEELEVKLREMMGECGVAGEETKEETKEDNDRRYFPVTSAYQLFAHKLDIAWLRVITHYKNIIELLPFVICERGYVNHPRHLHTYAASRGAVDIVHYLLDEGIDPNGFYDGELLMLHTACHKANIEVVEILLQHGANPSLEDKDKKTPAYYAFVHNSIAIIDRLYFAGASFGGCISRYYKLNTEIIVRLFDLRVLKGEELLFSISLRGFPNDSYDEFFIVYNTLRKREIEEEKKRSESLRFLEEVLRELFERKDKSVKYRQQLTSITGHFMAECLANEDSHEMRHILLPYLHTHKIDNSPDKEETPVTIVDILARDLATSFY